MRRSKAEESVYSFIAYLTRIADHFSKGEEKELPQGAQFLECIRGVWSQLPYGFVDYLEQLVLKPLDDLGVRGIYEKEYNALKKIIRHLRDDFVPTVSASPTVAAFTLALRPLLADYASLVLPATDPETDAPSMDEDKVTAVFSGVWRGKFSHHYYASVEDERFRNQSQRFMATLHNKQQHAVASLRESEAQLSAALKSNLPVFQFVLQSTAERFFQNRSSQVLTKSITDLVTAYHLLFESVKDELLGWLSARFGKGGESATDYPTYFCMLKDHMTVNGLLSVMAELNLQLSESQLYFLDFLKEELGTVALESQYEKSEYYSLFYSCYTALFTAATEGARALYSQNLTKRAAQLVEDIKLDKLGEERYKAIKRIGCMQDRLVRTLQRGDLVSAAPVWLRPLIFWVKRLLLWFAERTTPRLRDIKDRRVAYVNTHARQAKDDLYTNAKADVQQVTWRFRQALLVNDSPLMEHRITVLAKKEPRSVALVNREYENSV